LSQSNTELKDILQAIASGNPQVIVIHGDCDFMAEWYLQAIVEKWAIAQPEGVVNRIDAKDCDLNDLCTSLTQPALFEAATLMVVKRLESHTKVLSTIFQVAEGALANSVILLIGHKLNAKQSAEAKKSKAKLLTATQPRYQELQRFVEVLAEESGVKITKAGLRYLIEQVGENLGQLRNEFVKLSLIFQKQTAPLLPNQIAPHIGAVREDHIFKIDQYFLSGQFDEALIFFKDLLDRGESPLGIVSLVARHVRLSLNYKEFAHSATKLPPLVAKSYKSYVNTKSTVQFEKCLAVCQLADMRLKSTKVDPEVLLMSVVDTLR